MSFSNTAGRGSASNPFDVSSTMKEELEKSHKENERLKTLIKGIKRDRVRAEERRDKAEKLALEAEKLGKLNQLNLVRSALEQVLRLAIGQNESFIVTAKVREDFRSSSVAVELESSAELIQVAGKRSPIVELFGYVFCLYSVSSVTNSNFSVQKSSV